MNALQTLQSSLDFAIGETTSVRIAKGPGSLSMTITGVLYPHPCQPRASLKEACGKRYLLMLRPRKNGTAMASVGFCAHDVEVFNHADNTIYLK